MKKKLFKCFFFYVLLLTQFSVTFAQTTDSILTKKIELLEKEIKDANERSLKTDSSISNIAKDVKQEKQKKDSISNTDSASLFNAWKYAVKHPEILYSKVCDQCGRNWIVTIFVILFLLYFLYKAFYFFINTALCRDESYFMDIVDGQKKLRAPKLRPYSYSRVQMFWWTIIIVCCYGIFYALYGKLIPLNPTCILLLGGGLAIQIFGKTIDNSQKENDRNKTNNSDLPTRHQDLYDSQGFLIDILSDENGVSMHRLQSVAFNIIYGIGFIGFFITSIGCRQYPFIEFEGWQLTLLGISAGGYLGLKTIENGKGSEEERINKAVALENESIKTDLAPVKDGEKNIASEQTPPARDENNYQ